MEFKERSSGSTKYLHIYERLRNDITSGVYPRGSKLPSKRDMADSCSVSLITVEHAYELLADEGYITPEEKRGYFVTYDEAEMFPVGAPHSAAADSSVPGTLRSGMAGASSLGTLRPGMAGASSSGTLHSGLAGAFSSGTLHSGLAGASSSDSLHSGLAEASFSDSLRPDLAGASSSGTLRPGMAGASSSGTLHSGLAGASSSDSLRPGMAGASSSGTHYSDMAGASSSDSLRPDLAGASSSGTLHSGLAEASSSDSLRPGMAGASSSDSLHSGMTGASSSGTHHSGMAGASSSDSLHSGLAGASSSDSLHSGLAGVSSSGTHHSDMAGASSSDSLRPDLAGASSPQSGLAARGSAAAHGTSPDAATNTDTRALPFTIYARTVRHVISTCGDVLASRSPGFGCECLRSAIASYLRRSRHMDVSPDCVVIGSGAEYLYSMIVKALGRDLRYAVESPSYHRIAQIYSAEGVSLEQLPLGNDGIESSALRSSEAEVLHITPYRSFPSGVTASASKKHEYLRFCRERNAIIIEDDAESEFSPLRKPEETLYALDGGCNVIYVNTFTRTIGSFLRAAYMVVPDRLAGLFTERIGMYACTVPTLEQYVLAELLDKGDFERHINRVRRKEREHEHIRSTG